MYCAAGLRHSPVSTPTRNRPSTVTQVPVSCAPRPTAASTRCTVGAVISEARGSSGSIAGFKMRSSATGTGGASGTSSRSPSPPYSAPSGSSQASSTPAASSAASRPARSASPTPSAVVDELPQRCTRPVRASLRVTGVRRRRGAVLARLQARDLVGQLVGPGCRRGGLLLQLGLRTGEPGGGGAGRGVDRGAGRVGAVQRLDPQLQRCEDRVRLGDRQLDGRVEVGTQVRQHVSAAPGDQRLRPGTALGELCGRGGEPVHGGPGRGERGDGGVRGVEQTCDEGDRPLLASSKVVRGPTGRGHPGGDHRRGFGLVGSGERCVDVAAVRDVDAGAPGLLRGGGPDPGERVGRGLYPPSGFRLAVAPLGEDVARRGDPARGPGGFVVPAGCFGGRAVELPRAAHLRARAQRLLPGAQPLRGDSESPAAAPARPRLRPSAVAWAASAAASDSRGGPVVLLRAAGQLGAPPCGDRGVAAVVAEERLRGGVRVAIIAASSSRSSSRLRKASATSAITAWSSGGSASVSAARQRLLVGPLGQLRLAQLDQQVDQRAVALLAEPEQAPRRPRGGSPAPGRTPCRARPSASARRSRVERGAGGVDQRADPRRRRWSVDEEPVAGDAAPGYRLEPAADRAELRGAVVADAAELQPGVAEPLGVRVLAAEQQVPLHPLARVGVGLDPVRRTGRRRAGTAASARAPWTCRCRCCRAAAAGRRGTGTPRRRSRRGRPARPAAAASGSGRVGQRHGGLTGGRLDDLAVARRSVRQRARYRASAGSGRTRVAGRGCDQPQRRRAAPAPWPTSSDLGARRSRAACASTRACSAASRARSACSSRVGAVAARRRPGARRAAA